MKRVLRGGGDSVALLCLTIGTFAAASAQVVITAANVSAQLAPGITITSRTDTATKTINIGSPGATSWNYSALVTNITSQSTCVRPDTTPFFIYFPGATNAERVSLGAFGTVYSYMQLGTDLLLRGSALSGTFQERSLDTPNEILYKLPLTLGTSWTTAYVESTIVVLPPTVTTSSHLVSNSVDAYGSLTLPGGGTYDALRVKTDSRITTVASTSRSIWYTILAANGASAVVFAADTLQPDNGVIKVASVTRTNPVLTDVAAGETAPTTFALDQNYPNPFNPSTVISYQLPGASTTRLVVSDLLGREVAVLVNELKAPGRYSVRFDASGLASGAYFYRLSAGSFVQTRKFAVVR